jgi:cell wall-associated NlpC family hydrolase
MKAVLFVCFLAVAFAAEIRVDGDDRIHVAEKFSELANRDGQCWKVTTALNVRSSVCGGQIGTLPANSIVKCSGSTTTPSSCSLGTYNWQRVTGVSGSSLSGYAVDKYLSGPVTCPGSSPPTPPPTSTGRAGIVTAAMALYNNRYSEHYTQGSSRWIGITNRVYPPSAPTYSDCSSAATWCYWTQYGNGPDMVNAQQWKAGYTGTMIQRGTVVSVANARPGDLCFYYNPVSHVSIYIGNNQVVSHGSDPVSIYNVYNSLNHCRSYLP